MALRSDNTCTLIVDWDTLCEIDVHEKITESKGNTLGTVMHVFWREIEQ